MGVNSGQMMVEWTEERVADLKRLFHDGLTATQIANEMGCFGHCLDGGRSAVCGKLSRLHLQRGDNERALRMRESGRITGRNNYLPAGSKLPRFITTPKSQAERIQERRKREVKTAIGHPEPVFRPEKFVPREPVAPFLGIALIDLEPEHCRFPRGGDEIGEPITFCGQSTPDGESYCRTCNRIVYAKAPNVSEQERARRRARLIRSFNFQSAKPAA